MATESVEDVGGAGEVGHELVRARVGDAVDLSGRTTITVSSSRTAVLACK